MSAFDRGYMETRHSEVAGTLPAATLAVSLLGDAYSRVEVVWSSLKFIVSSIRTYSSGKGLTWSAWGPSRTDRHCITDGT